MGDEIQTNRPRPTARATLPLVIGMLLGWSAGKKRMPPPCPR